MMKCNAMYCREVLAKSTYTFKKFLETKYQGNEEQSCSIFYPSKAHVAALAASLAVAGMAAAVEAALASAGGCSGV